MPITSFEKGTPVIYKGVKCEVVHVHNGGALGHFDLQEAHTAKVHANVHRSALSRDIVVVSTPPPLQERHPKRSRT